MARDVKAPRTGCSRSEGEDTTTSTRQSNRKDVPMSMAQQKAPTHLHPLDAAGIVDGAYVVVVKIDDGHHRRRTFLSLTSAEKAAARARTRGQGAEVVLCRLSPVIGWTSSTAHGQDAA